MLFSTDSPLKKCNRKADTRPTHSRYFDTGSARTYELYIIFLRLSIGFHKFGENDQYGEREFFQKVKIDTVLGGGWRKKAVSTERFNKILGVQGGGVSVKKRRGILYFSFLGVCQMADAFLQKSRGDILQGNFDKKTKRKPKAIDFRFVWWAIWDSNLGPTGYEPVALTN